MTVNRTLYAGIIAAVVVFLYSFLTDHYLFSWIFLIVPGATIWREIAGSWYAWSIIIMLFTTILFAFVYALIQESVPGIRFSKGIIFGIMAWIIGVLPAALFAMHYTKLSIFISIYFLINCLIKYIIVGFIFAMMLTEKSKVPV
jgi:hypothetical protein